MSANLNISLVLLRLLVPFICSRTNLPIKCEKPYLFLHLTGACIGDFHLSAGENGTEFVEFHLKEGLKQEL